MSKYLKIQSTSSVVLEEWEICMENWNMGIGKSISRVFPSFGFCFSYCGVYPKDHRIQGEIVLEQFSNAFFVLRKPGKSWTNSKV